MESTKTEAAALTIAHDSAVAHEAAGTGSPPVTGGMAAPPIPRTSGFANEFPSSMEKTKTEAAALTVVHDYAVAHKAAGTGSPGTAPVTGGMAAPPIPRASGLVTEFPITSRGCTSGRIMTMFPTCTAFTTAVSITILDYFAQSEPLTRQLLTYTAFYESKVRESLDKQQLILHTHKNFLGPTQQINLIARDSATNGQNCLNPQPSTRLGWLCMNKVRRLMYGRK
ncbi:hypothetical protein B0H13DRAFT_1879056 [Mycena leptocephala]|nr:hypothetical protein B0H13DRAFT_1879056 [Mycena leptocephala]